MPGIVKDSIKAVIPTSAWLTLKSRVSSLKSWGQRNDLPALARHFDTDKWGERWYAVHYQRHLAHLKHRRFNLLEIGVGGHEAPDQGGASLRMWKAFFPAAQIYGIDLFDKSALEERRIKIFRGSQADPEFLRWVANRIGRIDVVIDDGSHINEHVIVSFKTLFPLLPDGGIYAIEDLCTSYWPEFGGRDDPAAANTGMGMLKQLVDGINWEEYRVRAPGTFDRMITSVHFYHNLAFVCKGRNEEGSNKDDTHKVHLTSVAAQ